MIEVRAIAPFGKELKRLMKKYKTITSDIYELTEELKANPYLGTDLGKGIRKVRMAIKAKGKGKSHGARVITYTDAVVNISEGVLRLLYIYDKAERSTISDKEIQELLKYIEE